MRIRAATGVGSGQGGSCCPRGWLTVVAFRYDTRSLALLDHLPDCIGGLIVCTDEKLIRVSAELAPLRIVEERALVVVNAHHDA